MRYSDVLDSIPSGREIVFGALVFALVLSVPVPAVAQEGGGVGVGYYDGDPSFDNEQNLAYDYEDGLLFDRRRRNSSEERQFQAGTALLGFILSGNRLQGLLEPSGD